MKIYNKNAPSCYNKYWSLEDDNPILKEMSSDLLSGYILNWGQTNKERLECLAKVANSIGFHIRVIEHENISGFKVSDKESNTFNEFREKIRNISRGNYESEVVQISEIIQEFAKKNKKWYEFWK